MPLISYNLIHIVHVAVSSNGACHTVKVISDGARAIALGGYHSMMVNHDGSIWATGSNKDGQFGDGTTKSERTFVRLTPFVNGECEEG